MFFKIFIKIILRHPNPTIFKNLKFFLNEKISFFQQMFFAIGELTSLFRTQTSWHGIGEILGVDRRN